MPMVVIQHTPHASDFSSAWESADDIATTRPTGSNEADGGAAKGARPKVRRLQFDLAHSLAVVYNPASKEFHVENEAEGSSVLDGDYGTPSRRSNAAEGSPALYSIPRTPWGTTAYESPGAQSSPRMPRAMVASVRPTLGVRVAVSHPGLGAPFTVSTLADEAAVDPAGVVAGSFTLLPASAHQKLSVESLPSAARLPPPSPGGTPSQSSALLKLPLVGGIRVGQGPKQLRILVEEGQGWATSQPPLGLGCVCEVLTLTVEQPTPSADDATSSADGKPSAGPPRSLKASVLIAMSTVSGKSGKHAPHVIRADNEQDAKWTMERLADEARKAVTAVANMASDELEKRRADALRCERLANMRSAVHPTPFLYVGKAPSAVPCPPSPGGTWTIRMAAADSPPRPAILRRRLTGSRFQFAGVNALLYGPRSPRAMAEATAMSTDSARV